MNTLSKQMTARFFKSPDGYEQMVSRWSQLMQDKEARKDLDCATHTGYLILRGKDWRKGFTSVTNQGLLATGREPGDTRYDIIRNVHASAKYGRGALALFNDLLSEEARELVPSLVDNAWCKDEAYNDIE